MGQSLTRKPYFCTSDTISVNPKKIRFVEVVISFCKGAGVKEVGSNQIKHTLLRSRITIETDEDTMATTRSEDTWFILQVHLIKMKLHLIKMKKKLFFKVGSKAQCAHEQKKITSDRWILKIMSEDESIELENLGNKSFKKKRKNRIKKKTFLTRWESSI